MRSEAVLSPLRGWRLWVLTLLLLAGHSVRLCEAGCALTPDADGHVDVPSTWTSIGVQAFYGCVDLKTITIPSSVTSIQSQAFRESGLESLTVPGSIEQIGVAAF